MLAAVIGGLVGISQYFKRAVEGRLAKEMAGGEIAGSFTYVPGLTEAEMTTVVTADETDTFSEGPDPNNVNKRVITIVSKGNRETAMTGRRRVDEKPFWRLFD